MLSKIKTTWDTISDDVCRVCALAGCLRSKFCQQWVRQWVRIKLHDLLHNDREKNHKDIAKCIFGIVSKVQCARPIPTRPGTFADVLYLTAADAQEKQEFQVELASTAFKVMAGLTNKPFPQSELLKFIKLLLSKEPPCCVDNNKCR